MQKKWDRIEKAQREEDLRTEVEIIKENEKELWVEIYKPKTYLELLSDEVGYIFSSYQTLKA